MATKHKMSMELAPDADAIEILTADHKRVAKLFAQFDALKDDGGDAEKAAVVAQICQELTVHTTLEEEIFYPAVRKAIDDDDLMDEAVVEHAGAKELIAQLQAADPGDDLYDAKVTVLGEQIDHHVEEEEGNMFPQVKGSGIDTISLGGDMLARKAELLADPAATPRPSPPPTGKMADDIGDDGEPDLAADNDSDEVFGKPKRPSASKTAARPSAKKKTKASKKKR